MSCEEVKNLAKVCEAVVVARKALFPVLVLVDHLDITRGSISRDIEQHKSECESCRTTPASSSQPSVSS